MLYQLSYTRGSAARVIESGPTGQASNAIRCEGDASLRQATLPPLSRRRTRARASGKCTGSDAATSRRCEAAATGWFNASYATPMW